MTTRIQVINKAARDQVMGTTAAAGIKPTTIGIARKKLLFSVAKRSVDMADAISRIVSARDSGDDEAKQLAAMLIGNPTFMKAMIVSLTNLENELKAAASAQPTSAPADTSPTAGRAQPEGSEMNGADYPEANAPNNERDPEKDKGSGLPGADAAHSNLAAYVATAAPTSLEARTNAASAAEAAQRRKAVLAHVKVVGSVEDQARVALGLERNPDTSGLDRFFTEPAAPSRPDRPFDR